jgi:hypothetical protein
MVPVLTVTAVLLALRLIAELVLSALNRAEVRRHADAPPPAVAAIMDGATYRKAVAYTLEKSRFGDLSGLFDTLVLALVLFLIGGRGFGMTRVARWRLLRSGPAFAAWLRARAMEPTLALLCLCHGDAVLRDPAPKLREAAAKL